MTKEASEIAHAFAAGRKLSKKRTKCDGDNVFLHGSRIAWRDEQGVIWVSFCGWNTKLTNNRVNRIASIFQRGGFRTKRGQLYWEGEPVSAYDNIPLVGPLGAQLLKAERELAAQD